MSELENVAAEFIRTMNNVAEKIRQVITAAEPARASLSQSRPMKHLAGLIGQLILASGPAEAALQKFQATVAALAEKSAAEMKPNL